MLGHLSTKSLRLSRYLSNGDWLPELRCLPTGESRIALTFDDGPTRETTPAILTCLARYRAKATFFFTGMRAAACPELVQAVVDEGHDVFPHGWRHIHYDEVAPERLIDDLERCESVLKRFRNTPAPYLIRLPYTAGHRSAGVHRALRRWNATVQLAHYSVTFNDWRLGRDCRTLADVEAQVSRVLSGAPYDQMRGKIVLLHEAPFDSDGCRLPDPPPGAAVGPILLRRILAEFALRGFETTRIAPMSRQSPYSRYLLAPRRKVVVSPKTDARSRAPSSPVLGDRAE